MKKIILSIGIIFTFLYSTTLFLGSFGSNEDRFKLSKEQRINEALTWRYNLLLDPSTGTFNLDMYQLDSVNSALTNIANAMATGVKHGGYSDINAKS